MDGPCMLASFIQGSLSAIDDLDADLERERDPADRERDLDPADLDREREPDLDFVS